MLLLLLLRRLLLLLLLLRLLLLFVRAPAWEPAQRRVEEPVEAMMQ